MNLYSKCMNKIGLLWHQINGEAWKSFNDLVNLIFNQIHKFFALVLVLMVSIFQDQEYYVWYLAHTISSV